MGGSAIGGDVVSIMEKSNINCPFIICRGYDYQIGSMKEL